MKVAIPHAKPLHKGVWMADVSDSELRLIPGRAPENGGKNVVTIVSPEYVGDSLVFPLAEARLASRASGQPTLFVERVSGIASSQINATTARAARLFWVSVSAGAQENFARGLKAGVWGVKDEFRNHLLGIRPGDFALFYQKELGFALCRVESEPYHDETIVWADGIYPHRVKISAPLKVEPTKNYADVSACLRDANGNAFSSPHAANRAISGHGGTFRSLSASEVQDLLKSLNWPAEIFSVGIVPPLPSV